MSDETIDHAARAMHERNRIQQVADCLGAGHEIPKTRYEFMAYDHLPDDARWLMREIARAALAATRDFPPQLAEPWTYLDDTDALPMIWRAFIDAALSPNRPPATP